MFKIFTDFDGTISTTDVGDALFDRFADTNWSGVVQEWIDGKISSKEVFRRGCESSSLTKQQLEAFCGQQQIDPYFAEFIAYCRQQGHPVIVLSDGLDYYIQRILNNHGFGELQVYANEIVFMDHDKIRPEFPYFEKGCLICGNCKGFHLRAHRNDGDILVYIGDGYSDRCAVPEADILFAKNDLKNYCVERNIPFNEFITFAEVVQKLQQIEENLNRMGK
ncbi:MAG: MtnX-like HAD-IB family phosphatase [bacterium]|nr:MtnX-like HAD-IB family phosphatase [bacterium]